jgi:hypothetical protein
MEIIQKTVYLNGFQFLELAESGSVVIDHQINCDGKPCELIIKLGSREEVKLPKTVEE